MFYIFKILLTVIVLPEALQTETELMFVFTGLTNRHSEIHFRKRLHHLQLLKLLRRKKTRSNVDRSTNITSKIFSTIFCHKVEQFPLLGHLPWSLVEVAQ